MSLNTSYIIRQIEIISAASIIITTMIPQHSYMLFLPTVGNPECNSNTWTDYDRSCCTVNSPCTVGEGDCDSDDQCIGGLKCGKDNCGHDFPPLADCCEGSILNININIVV